MARVDPRAVLAGRVPGRPPISLVIGLVISSICALIALGLYAWTGGTSGFAIGLTMAVLPVPLLVSAVLLLDRLEPEPWRDLVFAFMWGAGVAVLGALILNTIGYEYLTQPKFGTEQGHFLAATLGAPVIEESFKGAVLFGFLWFRRNEIDNLTDGIIYAAMVALGFAMMENVAYYMKAFDVGGGHQLEAVFILRSVLAPFGHPLFTSMTGMGVAYAATGNRRVGRWLAPIVGLLAAMILHGLWNGATAFGYRGLIVVYLFDLVILATLLSVIIWERRQLVRLIGTYLPMYGGTGLVAPLDVRMLERLPARRDARRWARKIGGSRAAREMGIYQQAATELALLHQRADRGIADQSWFEQRQVALLGLMRDALEPFRRFRGFAQVPPWTYGGPTAFRPPPPPMFEPPRPYGTSPSL
jgi:RsiW-degrading membrane proteinase PrsW (M82 family)